MATIKNYRSAISAIHRGFPDGSSVLDNQPLKYLTHGMFTKRPPTRHLIPAWDLGQVLHMLTGPPFKPIGQATLLHMSIKLAFLLAVATSQRGSELQALSTATGHIRWEPGGVRFVPTVGFLTKNQTASFDPPDIFVPSIESESGVPSDKLWCPVRALKWYLSRTKHLRGDTQQLFIITTHPHRPAARDTIARWVVSTFKFVNPIWQMPADSHVQQRLRAHDVRAISA